MVSMFQNLGVLNPLGTKTVNFRGKDISLPLYKISPLARESQKTSTSRQAHRGTSSYREMRS